MNKPAECHLWQMEKLSFEDLNAPHLFESLQTFMDDSHLRRSLLKCWQCGQLYFYEFYEEIDWDEGDDRQYSTYIPVETIEEAQKVAKMSRLDMLQLSPRLHRDFPKGAQHPSVVWVGKDSPQSSSDTHFKH